MKKKFNIIEFEKFVNKEIREDHRIGDQIFLMDEYRLNPISDLEFRALENIFIEVLSGKGFIVVDGIRHDVKGHCLLVYLKGQNIKISISGSGAVQRGAAFSDEFMEDMYRSAFRFNDIRISLLTNPVVNLDANHSYGINTYISTLKHIAEREDNPHNMMCAKYITLALFYGPLYGIFKNKLEEGVSRTPLISSKFFALVDEYFKEKMSLALYAERLNISKPYLHQCITATTGKAPGYWIDYYRLSYAKKCLSSMTMSILQVAQNLNFAGLPQFCKFFKNHTGLTPTEFRRTLS